MFERAAVWGAVAAHEHDDDHHHDHDGHHHDHDHSDEEEDGQLEADIFQPWLEAFSPEAAAAGGRRVPLTPQRHRTSRRLGKARSTTATTCTPTAR
jgi:hypothetical protein